MSGKSKWAMAVALAVVCGAHAQGFVNLNFENPILPLVQDVEFMVPASDAIPGWTAYVGGVAVDRVGYNAYAIDAASVSLTTAPPPLFPWPPIDGSYSFFFQSASHNVQPGYPTSVGIGQTGMIPIGTQSLFFVANYPSLVITFDGQPIAYSQTGTYLSYNVYGANISTYAGQTGELLFTCPQAGGGRQEAFLDNIQFSAVGIPEPTTLSLFGLGLLAFGWWRRQRA